MNIKEHNDGSKVKMPRGEPSSTPGGRQPASSNNKCLIICTNAAFISPHQQHESGEQEQACRECQTRGSSNNNQNTSSGPQRTYRFTGVDVYEVACLWQTLSKNYEIDFCSPEGGPVAADPHSLEMTEQDEQVRRAMRADRAQLINLLGHTYPIKWVRPEEYECCIVTGSHGAMLDLPECKQVTRCITEIYENGGLVGTIGHGAAALINCKSSQSQQSEEEDFLVKGKRMCCFSEREEHEARFAEAVPYSLERRLRDRGARLENQKPFESQVVEDGRLLTAQNARSAQEFAERLQKCLSKQKQSGGKQQ